MTQIIQRLDDALALIEKSVIVICFSLLVVFIVFKILSRNLFHLPSHQIFEAGPNLVLWISLLGASLALKQHRHIRLELVLRFCSMRIRRLAGMAVGLFGAVVMGILLVTSLEFVSNEIAMFGLWGRLSIIFPVFFSVAAFRFLTGLLVRFPLQPTVDAPRGAKTSP
jgi:TRAP-type C4-dicarboxylate transport system permease small subunit